MRITDEIRARGEDPDKTNFFGEKTNTDAEEGKTIRQELQEATENAKLETSYSNFKTEQQDPDMSVVSALETEDDLELKTRNRKSKAADQRE
jgi:hypothetical protein